MGGFRCQRCSREVSDIYQLEGESEWLCRKCHKLKKKELGIVDDPRIVAEVLNIGVTESGMTLKDREGNIYQWLTKSHSHKMFFTHDWVKVSMTLVLKASKDSGQKIVKNIRFMKG